MDLFTIGMARSKTSGGAADYHICSSSEYSSVTGLPTVTNPAANRLYLVPVSESAGNNHYNEYYYKNGNWELFGNGTKQIEFDNTPIQASENAVTSGGVYDALSEISGDLTELEARVNNTISAVGSPLIATTAADMTNIDKVYVYQGNETGYTSGNWYYYNGTSWASGGVYNATAVSTDKTLTVENTAADAKAVGDGLDNLINISTTQPSDSDNRLWINPENSNAIEVPTQAEMVAFETQVESTVEGLSESFAPEFDDATVYSIGDYVVNDGVLYKFTSNHAAGVWNNSHVQTVTVMNEVESLSDNLDTLETTVGNIVDNTLSLSGKAADAKKVGDEISDLKDDLEESVETLEAEIESIVPGLSATAKDALMACFAHVAWIDDQGQDYYDALYEALYEPTPQWLLEWSYLDGATPIAFAPSDWASGYSSNIWSFVSGKGARVALPSSGNNTANLYPKNYETSSNSAYQVKFNFASLPTSGGVFIRLGNGSVGMETLINANGVSIDHGANYLSGITIEANVDYVVKAVRNADGCSLYFNNNLVWTGQSADIGNKKNHILVTVPTGSTDVYFSEIKFNTEDSYWDYEWDASSETLPTYMTADYYDFTTESGAMFVKTPVLDFDYIGNCKLQIEMKAYCENENGQFAFGSTNNPQILIKNAVVDTNQFRGIKIIMGSSLGTSSDHGMSAVSVNGANSLIPESNSNVYHLYELTAENNFYTVTIDETPVTITQNTNTSAYYGRTGITTSTFPTPPGFFGAFIKSIKFKRL